MMRGHDVARAFLLSTLAVAMLLPGVPAGVHAQQPSDDLFDADSLHDIRLFINSKDLQQLIARFDENIFFPADLEWRGQRVRNVAVRARGATSRSDTKPGLLVDFSRYVAGRQFLGLGSVVLDNTWHDPTLLREQLAMAFFRRMGQPAPRVSLGRVYVNHTYYGVYSITEDLNADFLTRTFGDETGFLFEFKQQEVPFHAEYLGDALAPYKLRFEPRTRRLEADTTLFSPIRDLFREINQDTDAVWRDRVDALVDLEQFVTLVAIEQFLWEQDGLLGSEGMNNFYLYRQAGSTRHRLIPWDKDLTFIQIHEPTVIRGEDNELFRRAMEYPDLRDLYLRTVEEAARTCLADDFLRNEILRAASLVTDAAHADQRKPFGNEAFDEGIAFLLEFARERPRVMLEALARIPR